MDQNEAISITAGVSILALLIIGLYSVPGWIPALAVIILATMLNGYNDSVLNAQIESREQQDKLQRQAQNAATDDKSENGTGDILPGKTGELKTELLANDKHRQELLKDLETLGIDTGKFDNKTRKQIEKSLTNKERKQLQEFWRFLNDIK